ncbi:MAG: DUF1579 family protein [Planctomycetes bacterium]|nr:DUF1579 family protein [Planctomycetota bacterium]
MRVHAATATLAVALAAACHSPPPATDAQSSYEPRSEPGEGQRFLARMAGTWRVQKTFHRRDGGAPSISVGRCAQRLAHDGRFLISEFEFDGGDGRPASTGTGTIGFDPDTGHFTSFWIDSRSTRISVRASDEPFDGSCIRLAARSIAADSARQSRTETVLEDDDARIRHRQWSTGDAGERLVMELVMERSRD